MKNQRKFKLAKKLYAKYTALANEAYEAKGCMDSTMRQFRKHAHFCGNVLHKNGWSVWL